MKASIPILVGHLLVGFDHEKSPLLVRRPPPRWVATKIMESFVPEVDVTVLDEMYLNAVGDPMRVQLFLPPLAASDVKPANRPGILDVHGGMWTLFDCTANKVPNMGLARAGFVVASIDFRMGPDYQHPAASQDVRKALVWFRDNAERFQVDPTKIGMSGESSGGHLAMNVGIAPSSKQCVVPDDESDDEKNVIAPPKFLIALWPVSCPFSRYEYAKRANLEYIIKAQMAYFGTEDAMKEASIPRIVTAGETECDKLPPLLVVTAGEDKNVPADITFDLIKAWQSFGGGLLEYAYFPGEPHAFGLQSSNSNTQPMIDIMVDFAKRHSS